LTTRPLKNAFDASTPESTIAIAGACGGGAAFFEGFGQNDVTPERYGQW
jgi:hypothetical protein